MFTPDPPSEEPEFYRQMKDISWFGKLCSHLHGTDLLNPLDRSLLALNFDEHKYDTIPLDHLPEFFRKRRTEYNVIQRKEVEDFAKMTIASAIMIQTSCSAANTDGVPGLLRAEAFSTELAVEARIGAYLVDSSLGICGSGLLR